MPSDTLPSAALDEIDVLVVEDDPAQRLEMASYLGRVGLKVSVAPDGAAALEMATVCRPSVAIIDYNLPDTNGLALARKIREGLPVVALLLISGRIESVSEHALEEIGIALFATKPLPLGAIRQAILRLAKATPEIRHGLSMQKDWLLATSDRPGDMHTPSPDRSGEKGLRAEGREDASQAYSAPSSLGRR